VKPKLSLLIPTAFLAAGVATAAYAAPTTSAPPAHDASFATDMGFVHQMLFAHDKIRRTVTNLPNGIRTTTESDDPTVAAAIKTHVTSMSARLKDGRMFNVASPSVPQLFAGASSIQTTVEQTATGVIVTQTSTDPATVKALQTHAAEVNDLARGGMQALMRQIMANGGPDAMHQHMGMGMGPAMMHDPSQP